MPVTCYFGYLKYASSETKIKITIFVKLIKKSTLISNLQMAMIRINKRIFRQSYLFYWQHNIIVHTWRMECSRHGVRRATYYGTRRPLQLATSRDNALRRLRHTACSVAPRSVRSATRPVRTRDRLFYEYNNQYIICVSFSNYVVIYVSARGNDIFISLLLF